MSGGAEGTDGERDDGGDRPGSRSEDLDRPVPNRAMADRARCPFCDGTDTDPFSAFGQSVSMSQYYCRDCRTVFQWVKWRGGDGE